jgi:SprT protein
MAMNIVEAMLAVHERIEAVYQICEKRYNRTFPRPTVDFAIRGRTAGRAFCLRNHISFNRMLLMQEGDKFIENTPGHEVAHLVARHVYGNTISSHGNEWKSVMVAIGQVPNRCHDFEVRTGNIYFCKCPNREHHLSTRMHNSIQAGKNRICNRCRTRLVFKSQNVPIQPAVENEEKQKPRFLFSGVTITF